MSERNWLIPLAVGAVRAGEDFRRSMDRMLTQAAASPESVQLIRGGDGPEELTEQQVRELQQRITAGLEAHKSHRQAWRLDPDRFYRCPECDPVPPAAVARPTVCPCGHPVGDEYLCIEGCIYGPCGDENCGGVCQYHGDCKGQCACGEDE